jgi:hypothetical protein
MGASSGTPFREPMYVIRATRFLGATSSKIEGSAARTVRL